MLMMPDKKKIATVIVKHSDDTPSFVQKIGESSGVNEDNSIALESSAQELISAIAAKDAKRVAGVLKSFFEMVDDDNDDDSIINP